MAAMDENLAEAVAACAQTVFGDVRIAGTQLLRGQPGLLVARLSLQTDAGPQSVIAKLARPRERAALEVLASSGVAAVPRLLAACDDPPLVLMADAGDGASVSSHLMGSDPDAAAGAVSRWAAALAQVQVAGLQLGAAFRQRLQALSTGQETDDPDPDGARNPFTRDRAVGWKVAVTRPASDEVIIETIRGLRDGLTPLGVRVGPEEAAALRALAARLSPGSGQGALVPGDGCPDNNVDAPGGLVLVDLESADVRHVAWDASYLTVPWPTCWCSWRMPAGVQAAALARWREVLAPRLAPRVAATLDAAISDATIAWALITAAWFLGSAHRGEPLGRGGAMRPGPRELIQHRLGVAAAAAPGTELGRLAARAHDATRSAWGERPLLLAPAWR
jgi:hypothetical protein